MDLDETVLDNAAYSAWLAKTDQHYVEPTWQGLDGAAAGKAPPGALEFVKLAAKLKVDVLHHQPRVRAEGRGPLPGAGAHAAQLAGAGL